MELKVRLLKWSAGLPVAMLNEKTAKKIGIHTRDRVSIKTRSKEMSVTVDIIGTLLRKNQIAVSAEVRKRLDLKQREKVEVNLAETPKSLSYIKKKLNKKTLSEKEIKEIIENVVDNSLSESEIALFISAMYKSKMSIQETIFLTKAILETGNKLKLDKKIVSDKHSIGGVAGNRTTPIVISICASAGLTMPKTSSRAITSAAGTADVIETIAKVGFSIKQIKSIIKKTNACMVWGGGLGVIPVDNKIIKIEKMLKIDPEAPLLASIMSKKLALGSNHILIDIPYGKYAKVNKQRAQKLAKKFEKIAKYFKVKLKCVLTDGNQPIGNGIGPALELSDVIKILDPSQSGPEDLKEKSIFLAGELLELTKKAKKNHGKTMAREILESGKAFEKFKQIIQVQRGKIRKLKQAKYKKDILSTRKGKIHKIDNRKINSLARVAGCPVDKSSGVYLYFHVGDKVKRKDKIITIYSESKPRLRQAMRFYKKQKPIKFK